MVGTNITVNCTDLSKTSVGFAGENTTVRKLYFNAIFTDTCLYPGKIIIIHNNLS